MKDMVFMMFEMENAAAAEYPEIRSTASKALHSGDIAGFRINEQQEYKKQIKFWQELYLMSIAQDGNNEKEKRKNLDRIFGKIDKDK